VAKKQSAAQRSELRSELGLNTKPGEPVPIQPVQPLNPAATGQSNADIVESRRAEAAKESPSHWEILKASVAQDNSLVDLLTENPQFPIDMEFSGSKYWDEQQQRIDAMPGVDLDEVMEDVVGAHSAEEAEHWLAEHEKDYMNEQLLMEAGGKALLTRMAVSVFDPVDITLAMATGGTAGALLKGRKWGGIATAALSAGVATGGTEAYLASNNASRDETDVMFATLAGLGLGGGIGALITRAEAKKLAKISDQIAAGDLDAAAKQMGVADSAGAQRVAAQSDDAPDKKLAGAAYDNVEEALDGIEDAPFAFKRLNQVFQTLQAKLFWSESSIVRKASKQMLEGGYRKDKGVRGRTAEGTANLLHRTFKAGIFRESLPEFRAWAKANKIGNIKRNIGSDAGERFYSEVGRAMRGETKGLSTEAIQAAGKLRKYMDNIYDLAEQYGVKGFEKGALEDYFPRMINRRQFDKYRTKYGNKAMESWYARAIDAANDDISPELSAKIAKAYVHTMNRKVAGIETDLLHGVRLDDIDKLREVFDGYPDLDELVSELEHMKLQADAKKGTVTHGKRRIKFDETFEAPIRVRESEGGVDAEGGEEILKFHMLYENDARKVLQRYSQSMSGHIAMAKELGIKSRQDWEEFEKAIMDDALATPGRSTEGAKKEVERLREAYDLIVGRNSIDPNPTGDVSKMARTWTGYTYTTRGGQFGVNALAEIGNIIGAVGVRSFIRSMPEWKAMMKRGVDGEIEHDFARNVELLFAPGINGLTGVAIRNMDEFGERMDGESLASKVAVKADNPLRVGGRATATMSGLNLLTDLPSRIAGVEMIRKFAKFANGKKISAGQAARIRAMGIDDEMRERIFAMLRKDGAGIYKGKRLVDIDPEKMTDYEALDAMNFGLNREVRSGGCEQAAGPLPALR
jgi:hypothetical protein